MTRALYNNAVFSYLSHAAQCSHSTVDAILCHLLTNTLDVERLTLNVLKLRRGMLVMRYQSSKILAISGVSHATKT